jgi:hypothetical protein
MPLWFLLLVSFILVVAVLWFMFRLPPTGTTLFGWAPLLALATVWAGLAAVVLSGLLWVLRYPEVWVAVVLLFLDPLALASGVLVLWIYRGPKEARQTVAMQRVQAVVGLSLGLLAVVIGYVYVMTHKAPFTPVGM